jgi:hypothetical protein
MVNPIKIGSEIYTRNYQGLHVPLAVMDAEKLRRAWKAEINRTARYRELKVIG